MNAAQRRAWAALALGPAWSPRAPRPADGGEIAVTSAPIDASVASRHTAPRNESAGAAPANLGAARQAVVPEPTAPAGSPAPPAFDVSGAGWAPLRAAVEGCRACGLCETRTRTVFGVGPETARWMLIGEAPGADEDARGEPFVGRAGQLLDNMLASIGLDRRSNVFIANVLKCRPPRNRDPLPQEVAHCTPYLLRQIELLSPDVIVVTGRFSAAALLRTEEGVGRLRGRVHEYRVGEREVPVIVTYHPAYLLRRPEEKAKVWADLCLARSVVAR